MNHGWARVFDPAVFHHDRSITHAGDQVHEESAAMRLVEPDRIAGLAFEALVTKSWNRPRNRLGSEEQIEVLGVAANASVLPQCERTRDGVRDVLLLKQDEDFAEKSLLLLRDLYRSGRSLGDQRRLPLGHENLDVKATTTVVVP